MMKKAFTLIEILVALAIIALIMGASFSAFSGARASARDAKRKADLESIRSALEIYRNEKGYYPSDSNLTNSLVNTNPDLSYMSKVPEDPVKNSYSYVYVPKSGCSGSSCTTYELCSTLEIEPSGAVAGCVGSTGCGSRPCYNSTKNP